MVIFRFWGYFDLFLVSRVFWSIFRFRGWGVLVIFVVFDHIWSFYRFKGAILVILKDFKSTLVILKFKGHFCNFNYWVVGWVRVYP